MIPEIENKMELLNMQIIEADSWLLDQYNYRIRSSSE